MTRTDTWRRLAVETAAGATLLFDPADVFYLEAEEHDTLVRTARAEAYRSMRRLPEHHSARRRVDQEPEAIRPHALSGQDTRDPR